MNKFLPIPIIVLAVLLYFFFIAPLRIEIAAKQSQVDELDVTLGQIAEFEELRDSLVAKRNSISKENIDKLEKMLPEDVNVTRIALNMHELALTHALVIDGGLEAGEALVIVDEQVGRAGLNIELTGSYESISTYMDAIAKSLRIIDVDSLSFNSPGEGDPGSYRFNIDFKLYSFQDEL